MRDSSYMTVVLFFQFLETTAARDEEREKKGIVTRKSKVCIHADDYSHVTYC